MERRPSSKITVPSILVAAAVAVSSSCLASAPTTPRYGTLQMEQRQLAVRHQIELLQVKNGLVVALVPDDRTNLVTVDVRYKVGAADDPAGRPGMAHLVEHLLFEARPAPDGPSLGDRLADVALYHNAWTMHDETHYTARALHGELEALLDVEAARMQVACDQLDDAVFARERDVVLEEEAERAGPLDGLRAELVAAVWGPRHPYRRPVGGREIAAATRDEACAFIEAHVSPDRAILVVSGRIDVAAASDAIARRFGPIARRGAGAAAAIPPPVLDGRRSTHAAPIDAPTALVLFPAPAWGADDAVVHAVAMRYLGHLLHAGARERAWIREVSLGGLGGVRSRVVAIAIVVDDAKRFDQAVAFVHDQVRALGDQLAWRTFERVRGPVRTQILAGHDRFLGRGASVADYLQYTDHTWFFLQELRQLDELTGPEVAAYAKRLTRERSHAALIEPSEREGTGELRRLVAPTEREHDLQPWRSPVDPAEARAALALPAARVAIDVEELELPNGLRVLLAPDPESPLVDVRVVFPVGSAADPDDRPGLAYATAAVLDHDYDTPYEARELRRVEWALGLGTVLDWAVDEQTTTFTARGLATFADWHLWRIAWLLERGVFARDDVRELKRRASDAGDGDGDVDLHAQRLRERLYGAGHPYAAAPRTGAQLAKIGGKDLERFRGRWYRARGATLVIAGGFDRERLKVHVRELFGAWSGEAPPAPPEVPPIRPAAGPSWIAIADPERALARMSIAFAATSDPRRDRAARIVLERMLSDRARHVREGLGASYGVRVGYADAAGGSLLWLDGHVEPRRAGKALAALLDEVAALRDAPDTRLADFVRARRWALATVLADAAGAIDLAGELAWLAEQRLPIGYLGELARQVAGVTPEDVARVAALDLAAARQVVVISGAAGTGEAAFAAAGVDRAKVEVERAR